MKKMNLVGALVMALLILIALPLGGAHLLYPAAGRGVLGILRRRRRVCHLRQH